MIRRTLSFLAAALVAFHVWVLGDQLWQGALADPVLAARWLLAGALFGALAALRRRGVSIVWGRRAVAIWSLAALLHGPVILDRADVTAAAILPEIAATLAQATLLTAAGLGLALLLSRLNRHRRNAGQGRRPARTIRTSATRISAFTVLAPRPPPPASAS